MIKLPRLLANDGSEARRIRPGKVAITENIIPLSTATMDLPDSELIPDRSYVELFVPGRSAGIFRARIPDNGYGPDITTVRLEHAVCEVGDWVVSEAIDASVKPLSEALSLVFLHYGGTRWRIGTVEPTETVVCNISEGNVLRAMMELLEQVPDSYMDFDFTVSPWQINIRKLPSTVTAEGRLGRNITSARVSRDDSELYTRAYLKGLPAAEGVTIGHMDADTIGTYGVIETVLQEGDYTAAEAQVVAAAYLEKHKRPVVSVRIEGNDFSDITGEELDALKTGKLYRLAIEGNSSPVMEHITQLCWRNVYDQPGAVTVQLSTEKETASKSIHSQTVKQEKAEAQNNKRTEITRGTLQLHYERLSEQGEILRQAGMSIDPNTGVIIYADRFEYNIGSKLEVQADKIGMVVGTYNGRNYIKAGQIALAINQSTGESTALIDATHVNISGTQTAHLLVNALEQDDNGNLIIKTSGGAKVRKTEQGVTAEYGIYDEDSLTAGIMIDKINDWTETKISGDVVDINTSHLTINAQRIDINGIVTALSAYDVTVNTLSAGSGSITGDLTVGGNANIATLLATAFTTNTFYMAQKYATWQDTEVVIGVTHPTVNTSPNYSFVDNTGTPHYGALVISKAGGGVTTKTLHYLGEAPT